MKFSLRGIAWTAFGLAVVLLIGSSIFLLRATHALFQSETLIDKTREVQTVLEDLSSRLTQLTNSRRGFVITGDASFLSNYRIAASKLPGDMDRLRVLTSSGTDNKQELSQLEADIEAELKLTTSVGLRSGQGAASNREAQITRDEATLSSRLQSRLQKMRSEEDHLLSEQQIVSHSNYRHTLNLILASFIIALMLLLAEMFLLSYEFTRHRQTLSAALQNQEIVNAFFSASTVGFGIVDSHLRFTRVNNEFPRMTGREPEELLGMSLSEVFGEPSSRPEGALQHVLETGNPVLDREFTVELPGHSNATQYWLVNCFPIREKGTVSQVGLTVLDVTARRHAEEALRKLSGRLLGIQDQERRRIARELHDSLGQYLAGMKIAIDMLSVRSPELDPLLTECADILDKAISETRTLSHLLHPPLLDEAGFASAASWFVAGFSQRSGIPVSLDLPSDLPRLPEAVEIALFRVLQESLTNVHRHSRATSAEIDVEADAEQVTIEIRDHGQGMPREIIQEIEQNGSKLGVGLAGMRERIHELGGIFEVASDNDGTRVRAIIPLTFEEQPLTSHSDNKRVA
ncbi:MAG TPA: CHASE3 domain-containing protein [Terriglobales bacterium]|jgi:PAS domain S-box-containing protein